MKFPWIIIVIIVIVASIPWILRWLRAQQPPRCRHDLALRNLGSTGVYHVRVKAYTPATQILAASAPSGWTQVAGFPASVLWTPAAGGPIPIGDPLPGAFTVWVQNNAQPDKRVVVEWLDQDQARVCMQAVPVGCGPDFAVGPLSDPDRAAGCACLSAESTADEDGSEFGEPDLNVTLGTPVQSGILQVTVPYTIEVEPPQLQFTRTWEVTQTDELGVEQPITVPFSDNQTGQAVFTLPDGGDYNFYLTVTDPATCISATAGESEELSDSDFATFKVAGVLASIVVDSNVDPCDPLRYVFTSDSGPGSWTVQDMDAPAQPVIATGVGDVLDYTFASLNTNYMVCLTIQNSPTTCVMVKPALKPNLVAFGQSFISCGYDNFPVQFTNLSSAAPCPVDWEWDFGDGSPHSIDLNPLHVYAVAGTYTVTLTMTVKVGVVPQSVSTSMPVSVFHWEPGIHYHVCPDGHVIYETPEPPGWQGLKRTRTWTFPGEDGDAWRHRHKAKVRVCYLNPGVKIVKLFAMGPDNAQCEKVLEVNVPSINRCCAHRKVFHYEDFQYGGRDYRLRTQLRFHGAPVGVIFAKSKLQRKVTVGGKSVWVRKRAHTIAVQFNGTVRTESGGCVCMVSHGVAGSDTRSKRAVARRRVFPAVGHFRVTQGGLNSIHHVKMDGKDNGRDFTLSLWEPLDDCGCN